MADRKWIGSPVAGHRALMAILCGVWLAAVALCPAASAQDPEGQKVQKVTFEGLRSYIPEQILPRLKTREGQPYKALDVREDVNELSKVLRTVTVRALPVAPEGVEVRFEVSEFPRLRHVQIIGNHKVKSARIEGILGMKENDLLDETILQKLRGAIQKEYKDLGMPQTQVALNRIDLDQEPDAKWPLADLQVIVNEGQQVLCGDVVIRGNDAFSGLRLHALMETKGSWAFLKNYYDDATFEEDLSRLRDFYAAHGYFDAKIERGSFEERTIKGKQVISPVVQITEGKRYRLGQVTVHGVHLFGQTEAQEPFQKLLGEPFDAKTFGKAVEELKGLYQNHGLLTTEFQPNYSYDNQAQLLNVGIDVTEKERIYVGKIKVERPPEPVEPAKGWFAGWYERVAPPTRDDVILREVLLKPGDVYNKKMEQDSLRRLSQLGVFENDKLKAYNEPSGQEGVHNMVLQVQEAMTGALGGGVGFGDASGLFGFASLQERNVGGEGNVFGVQLTLGTKASSAEVRYLERHLGDSDDSLLTRVFYQQLRRPGYNVRNPGLNMEWGHPVAKDWRMYLMGRLESVSLSEASGVHAKEDLNRSYMVATGRLRFEQDTRLPLGNHPREGYLQNYGLEMGYAGAPLVRFEGSREQYWPLSEKLTWRLAASGGVMPYDRDVVPIHERFFLGGSSDMRGFKYRGAGYFDSKDSDVPIGGAAKLLAQNELLFPIYDPVSGVLFVDTGELGRSPASLSVPRVSTGTGVRFDFKNVRVALDVAAPVVKQSDDQTQFFHFRVQSAF